MLLVAYSDSTAIWPFRPSGHSSSFWNWLFLFLLCMRSVCLCVMNVLVVVFVGCCRIWLKFSFGILFLFVNKADMLLHTTDEAMGKVFFVRLIVKADTFSLILPHMVRYMKVLSCSCCWCKFSFCCILCLFVNSRRTLIYHTNQKNEELFKVNH